MATSTSMRINAVIICDDIRKEANGKAILIGVFAADILVFKLPATIGLSFWFDCFTKEHANEFEAKITLTNKSDNSTNDLFNRKLQNNIDNAKPIGGGQSITFALLGLPVKVEQNSTLIVSARTANSQSKWKELTRKDIILSEDSISP